MAFTALFMVCSIVAITYNGVGNRNSARAIGAAVDLIHAERYGDGYIPCPFYACHEHANGWLEFKSIVTYFGHMRIRICGKHAELLASCGLISKGEFRTEGK